MNIPRPNPCIYCDKSHYITKINSDFSIIYCTFCSTPCDNNNCLCYCDTCNILFRVNLNNVHTINTLPCEFICSYTTIDNRIFNIMPIFKSYEMCNKLLQDGLIHSIKWTDVIN